MNKVLMKYAPLLACVVMCTQACDCGGSSGDPIDASPGADVVLVRTDASFDAFRADTSAPDAVHPDNSVINDALVTDNTVVPCNDDALEDNDTPEQATMLATASLTAQICAGDVDWFSVALNAQDTITAHLTFTHADGDLDLYLLSAENTNTPIAVSDSTSDDEEIVHNVVEAGTYYLVVSGYGAVQNFYNLAVTVTPGVISVTMTALKITTRV